MGVIVIGAGVAAYVTFDRFVDALGHRLAEDLDDRAGGDLDPRVIAHEAFDPPDDARGEHHLVADRDLLVRLHLALASLALGPDQEHVADSEQQHEEDKRDASAGLRLGGGDQKGAGESRKSVGTGKRDDVDRDHARGLSLKE